MTGFENMEDELDPRLQQMLKAYAVAPERDPESVRRNQERFVAILNMIFEEQTTPRSASGWLALPFWLSSFNTFKEKFAGSFRTRAIMVALSGLIVICLFLFGGVGITAYAASSSLPGDTLYPLKTTVEAARADLTFDSAEQARLYLGFAGRRLSEIQSLINEGRYGDLPLAVREFEGDLQKAIGSIEGLSQTDHARAVGLSAEMITILRGYSGFLGQMLALVPAESQLAIQNAINSSQSTSNLLDATYDDFGGDDEGTDDENTATPSPLASELPQPTSTPDPSSEVSETPQLTETPVTAPTATVPLPATAIRHPTATPAVTVIQGGDVTCQGLIGAVTVDNVHVPQGASCTLDGTTVKGTIKVENGASLTAQRVTVIGNIQADGASFVEVLAGSTVSGSIQLKQGGAVRAEYVIVNGDIQYESNHGGLSAIGNQVGGNIQVFQNMGGVRIADNTVNGNLQCKENSPGPVGGNNTVHGNKEDQCAGL